MLVGFVWLLFSFSFFVSLLLFCIVGGFVSFFLWGPANWIGTTAMLGISVGWEGGAWIFSHQLMVFAFLFVGSTDSGSRLSEASNRYGGRRGRGYRGRGGGCGGREEEVECWEETTALMCGGREDELCLLAGIRRSIHAFVCLAGTTMAIRYSTLEIQQLLRPSDNNNTSTKHEHTKPCILHLHGNAIENNRRQLLQQSPIPDDDDEDDVFRRLLASSGSLQLHTHTHT
jgi:hypothetical protein